MYEKFGKWTEMQDQQPEDQEYVLRVMDDGRMERLQFLVPTKEDDWDEPWLEDDHQDDFYRPNTVLTWMPIPTYEKGEEEEKNSLWRPLKACKPGEKQDVLCVDETGFVTQMHYLKAPEAFVDCQDEFFDACQMVAWMPLPKYKKSKK